MSEPILADDYLLTLIPYFVEVFTESDVSNRVGVLRMDALRKLHAQLKTYEKRGYDRSLLCKIADKKGRMIMQITSREQAKRLGNPQCPHFDGGKFCPDAFSIPEEELICWSEASLKGSLNEYAYQRYMELFRQVFPEKGRELSI